MEYSNFNFIDYGIVVVMVLSVLISFLRGFIREVFSLAIWGVAALVSIKFADAIGDYCFKSYIDSPGLRFIAGFAALFVFILIIGAMINLLLSALIDRTGIGPVDRLLGVFFGAARGILIVGLVIMFLHLSNVQPFNALSSSKLLPQFTPLVTWLDGFLPGKLKIWGEELSQKAMSEAFNKERNTLMMSSPAQEL